MKQKNWLILFALSLIILSSILFIVHFIIFRDPQMEMYNTLLDIAFVPIQVLLVTLVIDQLLERRNLQMQLEKLNMVIGTFYSEIGTDLLRFFASFDPEITVIRQDIQITPTWDPIECKIMKKKIESLRYQVQIHEDDLAIMRSMLISKSDFLIRLLENPILLEHESFTDVLRAVFHLTDELKHRTVLSSLPESDMAHLKGDISRAYSNMAQSWLDYMAYLKVNYPYLFSLALRTNPFTEHENVIVWE